MVTGFTSWLLVSFDWFRDNSKTIGIFLEALVKRKPMVIAIIILLLIGTIVFGKIYWDLNNKYQEVFLNTLKSESEPTPQSYKGMESFILSHLNSRIDSTLKSSKLRDSFVDEWHLLEAEIVRMAFKAKSPLPNIKIAKTTTKKQQGEVLTDGHRPGFLFLPVNILGKSLSKDEKDAFKNLDYRKSASILKEIFKSENGMNRDIEFTKGISSVLKNFMNIRFWENNIDYLYNTPFQVYIVTHNGINRIFNNDLEKSNKIEEYYATQFPSTTFFPSRPYFWSPLEKPELTERFIISNGKINRERLDKENVTVQSKVEDIFYVSKPYMDLAGGGFVITVSRGIEIDGQIKAVVCFDFQLTKGINKDNSNTFIQFIKSKFFDMDDIYPNEDKFSINSVLKHIEHDVDGIQSELLDCELKAGGLLNDDCYKGNMIKEEFEKYYDKRKDKRSDVLGNIQVYSENKSALQVSIPLGNSYNSGSQENQVKLKLIKIDIENFRKKIFFVALLAFFCLGCMLSVLFYSWNETIRKSKDYEEALNVIDLILNKASIPYCRLDTEDYIKDSNPKFRELFTKSTVDKIPHKSLSFNSLCTSDYLEKYDQIQDNRKKNKKVNPYTLKMRTEYGDKLFFVVSGYSPASTSDSFPETFGILIDTEDENQMKYFELGRNI
ncbi:PDC sensor domain-containing protein [Larkinella rosea]|uniref:Uncharacterized protein n=1 Tax=Larkinella rosea TaxID=2025312 RepID=A0A3P1BZZ9_9BACT|nr:PDC sensor domain-containing protein [Larkinella rosea]RRB06741.1 hypothetical protein EHT25_02795 [Larkinella rosea]